MYIKNKLSVIERILTKNKQRNVLFCEVYFLGQNAPYGKMLFRILHIKEESFISNGLSLTLDADRVKQAKADTLTGIIYRYLKRPLGIKLIL